MFLHKNKIANINVSVIKICHDLLVTCMGDQLRWFVNELDKKIFTHDAIAHGHGCLRRFPPMHYNMKIFRRQLMDMKSSNPSRRT